MKKNKLALIILSMVLMMFGGFGALAWLERASDPIDTVALKTAWVPITPEVSVAARARVMQLREQGLEPPLRLLIQAEFEEHQELVAVGQAEPRERRTIGRVAAPQLEDDFYISPCYGAAEPVEICPGLWLCREETADIVCTHGNPVVW